jgi:hypothetical protein
MWRCASGELGRTTTSKDVAPEANTTQPIIVTERGRGGAAILVLQKGQNVRANQRLLRQFGQFTDYPSRQIVRQLSTLSPAQPNSPYLGEDKADFEKAPGDAALTFAPPKQASRQKKQGPNQGEDCVQCDADKPQGYGQKPNHRKEHQRK